MSPRGVDSLLYRASRFSLHQRDILDFLPDTANLGDVGLYGIWFREGRQDSHAPLSISNFLPLLSPSVLYSALHDPSVSL